MVTTGKRFSHTFRHGHLRLRKYCSSGIWQAKYRHPVTNLYVESSLGTTEKSDAIRYADDLNRQIVNRTLGVADGKILIKDLFRRFFAAKDMHLKFESQKRIRSAYHNLTRWLETSHPLVLEARQLTGEIIREFQAHRVELGRSRRTVDNDITNLFTVFAWAKREGMVGENPFNYSRHGTIDLFRVNDGDPDTYSPAEYALLVAEATNIGDVLIRDLIVVLAGTGMRFGEVTHLTAESLCWPDPMPYIDIRARNGWSPKDPREVKQVPMSPAVQEILRRRQRKFPKGLLFRNTAGSHVAENHSRERLQRLFPKVGIDGEKRRLHWHSWRNYFVLRCLEVGIPVHIIMQWTGHDTASMVLHYAKAKSGNNAAFEEAKKLF